jgi:hypothetical protein
MAGCLFFVPAQVMCIDHVIEQTNFAFMSISYYVGSFMGEYSFTLHAASKYKYSLKPKGNIKCGIVLYAARKYSS